MACGHVGMWVGLRQAIAVTVRDVDGMEFEFSVNEIESVQALSLRSSVDFRSRWLSGRQVPHPQSGLPVPRLGAMVFEASGDHLPWRGEGGIKKVNKCPDIEAWGFTM